MRLTLPPDRLLVDLSNIRTSSDDGAIAIARTKITPQIGLHKAQTCRAEIISSQPVTDC